MPMFVPLGGGEPVEYTQDVHGRWHAADGSSVWSDEEIRRRFSMVPQPAVQKAAHPTPDSQPQVEVEGSVKVEPEKPAKKPARKPAAKKPAKKG